MPHILAELESGRSVRLWPKGISMMPMLRQGMDSVILSPLPPKLKKYDIPLYRRKNGQYVLHRIVGVGETYTCMGDNQYQREPGVEHSRMIAVVTAFYRGDRLWQLNTLRYWLYCRLLPLVRFLRKIRYAVIRRRQGK